MKLIEICLKLKNLRNKSCSEWLETTEKHDSSHLDSNQEARRTSSKVINVPDGLFGSKTLSVIYFWNPQIKSRSMRITIVIFDSNQEGEEDFDVLQGDGCS